MSFIPNFSSSQSAGDLSIATFTDTSTDFTGITGRLIYLRKCDGNYLVPDGVTADYVYWPVVAGTGDTIEIDALDKDYCLDITVVYYNGSTESTSKTILTLFTGYGDLFLRQLTQALAANKTNIDKPNFWVNKNKLRVLLDDAAQAVSFLNDQTIAQFCLDEEKKLTDNISSFF
jgi:hypothetical protein